MPSWLRKGKKNNTQSKNHDEEEINQLSQVSNSMADDTQPDDADPSGEAHIKWRKQRNELTRPRPGSIHGNRWYLA
ncbi:hypothetical protein NQZ68_022209 [Dissostichus eleginoides]|nr:hypothetical protein NQZ68_022209 [Dissostichus eleginoides]